MMLKAGWTLRSDINEEGKPGPKLARNGGGEASSKLRNVSGSKALRRLEPELRKAIPQPGLQVQETWVQFPPASPGYVPLGKSLHLSSLSLLICRMG